MVYCAAPNPVDPPVPSPLGASAPLWTVLALAGAMVLKHYLADFVLQGRWMARGKERARGWAMPLFAHAGCHALLTLGMALAVAPRLWWVAGADLVAHAAIDRTKALVADRGGWGPGQAQYWRLLGLDQLLHHLTGLALIFVLLAP